MRSRIDCIVCEARANDCVYSIGEDSTLEINADGDNDILESMRTKVMTVLQLPIRKIDSKLAVPSMAAVMGIGMQKIKDALENLIKVDFGSKTSKQTQNMAWTTFCDHLQQAAVRFPMP